MPYELRGNKVCKVGGGVVPGGDHGSDHAAAVKHLRALKANVEERDMSGVLGVLLEGFDTSAHPRGWHGRWIRGRGGKPGRLEGTYNGIKLERGRAYQGKLATGEIFTGHWTGQVQGGVNGTEPLFKHVDDPSIVRTFAGGSGFGRLSDVKPASPNPMSSSSRERGLASIEAGRRSDRPRTLPTSRRATLGRAEGDAAARTRAEILAKSPGAQADLERYQSIARSARPRPAPNEQRSDEMASGPLRRPTEADMRRGREAAAGAQGVTDSLTAQGWTRDATGKLVPPADRSGVGPEGRAARDRGASSLSTEHADTRDKLTNLPVGQTYGLHGPRGQVGHVARTANGWEVQGGQGSTTSHKTPSSAAGAAMRIQRKAASSSQQADVMARNYRAGAEVRAMDARQAKRAEQESERQSKINALDIASEDRHGGFKVGDVVRHETGSRAAGGHGPVTFTKQPGLSTVVGLQRNGNLRIKHPETGTTHDVHHSHAQKVGPLHPDYRGKVVQDAYAAQRAELARQKAARARRPVREAAPQLLGALLEGTEGRVQEAIGHIEKGAFHRWLGKKEGEPITDADIKRGLAAGGHPAKMAAFAKAARGFGK